MEIKKEQIDQEIVVVQSRIKDAEALVNKLTGALSVLQDFSKYLGYEKPAEVPNTEISEVNKAIQDRDEALMQQQEPIHEGFAELAEAAEEESINASR